MVTIKNKLKEVRESLGFTQEEVAKEIGVTKTYYSNFEKGKRGGTIQTWLKIQKALCLSNDELVEAMKESIFF